MTTTWNKERDRLVAEREQLRPAPFDSLGNIEWSRGLGRLLQQRLEDGQLVFCMLSGKVMPRTSVVTAAYIAWKTRGYYCGVAGLENRSRSLWLVYEDPDWLDGCVASCKDTFDTWVSTGGLHVSRQWAGDMGGGRGHHLPHEVAHVTMGTGDLQVYTHLYQRFVPARHLAEPGHGKLHDYRRCDVFEQIRAASSRSPILKSGRVEELFLQLELPSPIMNSELCSDEWRRISRPQEFWNEYVFL